MVFEKILENELVEDDVIVQETQPSLDDHDLDKQVSEDFELDFAKKIKRLLLGSYNEMETDPDKQESFSHPWYKEE